MKLFYDISWNAGKQLKQIDGFRVDYSEEPPIEAFFLDEIVYWLSYQNVLFPVQCVDFKNLVDKNISISYKLVFLFS